MRKKAILFVCLLLLVFGKFNAQSVKRETIASYGSSVVMDGVIIQQTIGQPYITTPFYSNDVGIIPGFQQPTSFSFKQIKQSVNSEVRIFPNPATQWINIQLSDNIIQSVQITDMSGRILISKLNLNKNYFIVNCENWANGNYLISVTTSGNQVSNSQVIIFK